MSQTTIAQQLFDAWDLEYDLQRAVFRVFGEDPEYPTSDGWQVEDIAWDEYDRSIEIVRKDDACFMTTEQVTAILALGFSVIYETIGGNCRRWSSGTTWEESHPRKSRDSCFLRAKIERLENEIETLKPAAD